MCTHSSIEFLRVTVRNVVHIDVYSSDQRQRHALQRMLQCKTAQHCSAEQAKASCSDALHSIDGNLVQSYRCLMPCDMSDSAFIP